MLVSVGPPLADLQFLRTQATIMPALSGGGVNAQGQLPHGALHTRGAASAARTVRHTRKIGRSVPFLVLFSWYLFLVLVSMPALSGGVVNAQGQLPHGALHTRGAASARELACADGSRVDSL